MKPIPSPFPRLVSRTRKAIITIIGSVIAGVIANAISNGFLWHLVFPQHHVLRPLVINIPSTITATSKTNDGLRIVYQASAVSDRPNANPQVRCQPPSSSLFAIGSTIVSCTGTDIFGNSLMKSFQVIVEGPPPPPPRRALTEGPLGQALIIQSDLPGGWAPTDPSGFTDVGVGRIWACGQGPFSGTAFPASGQAAAATAAFEHSSSSDSVVTQAVSFYGDSARIYMESLVKAIQSCKPYDNSPKIESGPSLGGETLWLSAGSVSYSQEDVFVRVGSVLPLLESLTYHMEAQRIRGSSSILLKSPLIDWRPQKVAGRRGQLQSSATDIGLLRNCGMFRYEP